MISLEKLVEYFGLIGLASILCWMIALAVSLWAAWRRTRTKALGSALGVALIGLMLAHVNSTRVSEIEIDLTEEIEAQRERGRQLSQVETDAEPDSERESGYSYRDRGRVERAPSQEPEAGFDPMDIPLENKPEASARTMRSEELHRANAMDRINLFLARAVVWLAALLLGLDYLKRFNTPFDAYAPLPFSSRWLDAMIPKAHSALIEEGHGVDLQKYLEHVIRKGETFIYLGAKDLWPENSLPRVRIGAWPLFPIRKIIYTGAGDAMSADAIFESAWFGRYCAVMLGQEVADTVFPEFLEFLRTRQVVFATARKTVHIVWDLESPIPREALKECLYLCRETNYMLVLNTPNRAGADLRDLFDEVSGE